MFGWISKLFEPARKEVDDGLWYVVRGPFRVEVLVAQAFLDGYDDDKPPSRQSLKDIAVLNATAEPTTDAEATAVCTVLWNMDHFCENCGEEVLTDEKRCSACKKPLFKGKRKMQMVIKRV